MADNIVDTRSSHRPNKLHLAPCTWDVRRPANFMGKDSGMDLLEESLTDDVVGRGPPADRRNNGGNEQPLISALRPSSRADMILKIMFYSWRGRGGGRVSRNVPVMAIALHVVRTI